MRPRRAAALAAWVTLLVACVAVIAQTRFTADLSAFLPRTPTAEQQLLVDQLTDGMVSRLLLVAIEGGDAKARADASRALAQRLRADPAFGMVANGEPVHEEHDRKLLYHNRYLLSPAVTPERFTAAGLEAAIGESVALLASPLGMLTKSLLPADPTGEMLALVERFEAGARPAQAEGAWASRDGERALLLVQTRAAGSDMDAQQAAIAAVRSAFEATHHGAAPAGLSLLMTGPGVFAVDARATIREEVTRLALLSTAIVITLLLFIYRSIPALVLGLLPVVTGAVAAIAAVSLGFGMVHGITLGFGTTLIGEAVDYAIYLFVQHDPAGEDGHDARPAFWPTIRLGVMTSICGFAALLFSGFPGLAQLGLYSVTGLVVAAATARFVLPALLPSGFRIRDVSPLGRRLQHLVAGAHRLRWPLVALALAAAAAIHLHRDRVWNHELAALSPVPTTAQALDQALRADLGAPDVRYVVVVSAPDREAALAGAEEVGGRLEPLLGEGVLGGYESPAHYLPSQATQLARRASLPEAGLLATRLADATAGLPLTAEGLAPFLAEVEAARRRAPLTREDLEGTSFALAADSLLVRQHGRWSALLPLTAPDGGTRAIDAARVRAALATNNGAQAVFVDTKGESDRLYAGYLQEARLLALAGLAAIVALLALTLRSARRVAGVLTPLAAAVLAVVAGLLLSGVTLTILHLVGLLLIVAVGSNYALFFDRAAGAAGPAPRTLASMLFATLTTVAGFGLLAFSSVPVLQAIGTTVGPGAILALVFSAITAGRPAPDLRPS